MIIYPTPRGDDSGVLFVESRLSTTLVCLNKDINSGSKEDRQEGDTK